MKGLLLKINLLPITSVAVIIGIVFLLTGCYKFEGDQTIPSYIHVDSISLNTIYPEQGTSSHEITDAWVYVNDVLIGAYELPATLPILFADEQRLEIRPGIKVNGISSTRAPYPFYKPVDYDPFLLVPDSVIAIDLPTTEYYNNINFAWMEDFEQPGLTITEGSDSDTVIMRTQPANNPEAFLSEHSSFSGVIHLNNSASHYLGSSANSFAIPKQGSPTLLEVNFKTNNYLTVGVIVRESDNYVKIPLVVLNHSNDWNKIYVNLGPNLSLYPTAIDYKVYFETSLEENLSNGTIYLDNIKLINRPY